MSEPLLKPRSAYESAFQNREVIAERQVSALVSELTAQKSILEDHGYQIERNKASVTIKRDMLDIVTIVFNFGDTGKHRVINGVAEALRQGLDVTFDDPDVARYEFKNQLRHATDLFYANKKTFEALGLA